MEKFGSGNNERGLGIGDWGLGPIPNPQSPSIHKNLLILILKFKLNFQKNYPVYRIK
jgi:hypothetical protein